MTNETTPTPHSMLTPQSPPQKNAHLTFTQNLTFTQKSPGHHSNKNRSANQSPNPQGPHPPHCGPLTTSIPAPYTETAQTNQISFSSFPGTGSHDLPLSRGSSPSSASSGGNSFEADTEALTIVVDDQHMNSFNPMELSPISVLSTLEEEDERRSPIQVTTEICQKRD
jgi:hypothetical protein